MAEEHLRASGSTSAVVKCQICRTQAARYTCPTCNLRYCSIACFRSEKHGDCSESFYRASIISEVQGRDDVDNEDRIKVMDMLRRLQEADGQGETGLDSDEEEDDTERARLASALADLDLDDLSPEQLLAHLNPEQRKAFEALLADPERAAELLQEEDAPLDPQQFWWYRSTLDADVDQKDRKGKGRERPKPIPKDKLLQPPASSELDLGHNLVAILAGYGLAHRLCSEEDGSEVWQSTLARLLPFITGKSTLILQGAQEALEYVLGNVRSDLIQDRKALLLLLLADVAAFLSNAAILVNSEDHDSDKAFLALSDMHAMFASSSTPGSPRKKARFPLAGPKLLFYASNLGRMPRARLLARMEAYRTRLVHEQEQDTALQQGSSDPLVLGQQRTTDPLRVAKIEEIA